MGLLRRSIARKFGALYALLFGLITGISAVVVFHMHAMQRDARILLEETREHVIARDILSLLEGLRAELSPARSDAPLSDPRGSALDTLSAIRTEFANLADRNDDPSREEHQDKEDAFLGSIQEDLAALEGELRASETPGDISAETLSHAREYLFSLIGETRREYQFADHHLEAAGVRTTRVVAFTVAAAFLLIGGSLVLVFRGVIDPVRRLRRGAEELGRGNLAHRISIANTDELGSLARTFNDMAARVSDTHAELEERVAARTREFLRAARLADLGILAAGVAHEINNPLASISACAEGLQRRLQQQTLQAEELDEYLQIIQSESRRAKDITTRLLALARQERDEISEFELGLAIDHVEKAARHLLERASVALRVEVSSPETRIVGSAGELTQICMNLLTNAKDASPPGSTVRLDCEVEDDGLVVSVSDQGNGIAHADLDRVFEPFFTTKTVGSGTGLGLALVEAMVQARGGRISVESVPGEGTCFTVRLPLVWRNS